MVLICKKGSSLEIFLLNSFQKKSLYRENMLSFLLNYFYRFIYSSSIFTVTFSRCQISSTYSWMVRSEENLPE